ncbi:MAG TPA: hypothetical protein VE570_10885 [Thermoleophilaceae bacterium]|jgi:hypothetical protein|nr:hypothetical protein [Thermoleophilaceae bacterium]
MRLTTRETTSIAGPDPFGALPTRDRRRATRGWVQLALRLLGALSLLATGAVHLQQFIRLYHAVPTIGTLFVLNFAGATGLALVLLAPVERLAQRRGRLAVVAAAVGGIGLAASSFVFLLISERTPLFGFKEPGYDPPAIAAARAAEVATVLFLGSFLAVRARPRRAVRRMGMPRDGS